MDFGKVGNKKSIAWRFQKEWRYKFICLPIKAIFGKDFDTIHNEFIYHKLLNNEYRMPMDRIFLSLTDAAFSQMEITCSPKLSESNRIFIDLLKEKYNPTLTVRESTLKDSIR